MAAKKRTQRSRPRKLGAESDIHTSTHDFAVSRGAGAALEKDPINTGPKDVQAVGALAQELVQVVRRWRSQREAEAEVFLAAARSRDPATRREAERYLAALEALDEAFSRREAGSIEQLIAKIEKALGTGRR